MGKFVIRIGWCGFAIACVLFAISHGLGHPAGPGRLQMALWPGSILFASRHVAARRLGASEFFAVGFSALMNGAFYAGLAWLVWWEARLAGRAKAAPSAKARFISFFLALGLGFSLLVAVAEAALHRPRFTAHALGVAYLLSANLFALIVLTCALAGWSFWWLRGFFARRGAFASRR